MKKHPDTGEWIDDDESVIGSTCPECGMVLPTHRAVCSFAPLAHRVLKMNDVFSWKGRMYVYAGLAGYRLAIGQDVETKENLHIPVQEIEKY